MCAELRTWKRSCTIIPKYCSLVLRDQREIIKEEQFQWSSSDYTYSSQRYVGVLCQKRVGVNVFLSSRQSHRGPSAGG